MHSLQNVGRACTAESGDTVPTLMESSRASRAHRKLGRHAGRESATDRAHTVADFSTSTVPNASLPNARHVRLRVGQEVAKGPRWNGPACSLGGTPRGEDDTAKSEDFQVEQDLVIGHTLVAMFSDPGIAEARAFRRGTALYELYLTPPARYSEDIARVQLDPGSAGPPMDRLRSVFDPWLGKAWWKQP